MEEWKTLTTFKNTGRLFIEGDQILISNKGRIRLNDTILELGKGLYLDKGGNIHIVGQSYLEHKSFYRWIYYNFKGEYRKGCGYNIHHIDGNHLNNDVDNLIDLSAYEHGKIHAKEHDKLIDIITTTKALIKEQSSKSEEYILSTKQWYSQRIKEYYNSDAYKQKILEQQLLKQKQKQELLEKKRKEQQIKKEKELEIKRLKEEELIKAGTHFRCKNGRLMSYEQIKNMHKTKHDTSYITEEYRKRISESQKRAVKEGRNTGKCKDPEKEKQRIEKIKQSLKGNKRAKGYHHTPEAIERIREAAKKPRKKKEQNE